MPNVYTKHKDCTPEETVSKIKGALESAGLETVLKWNSTEYEGALSNRVAIAGTMLSTNGKGTTREYAMASGYAELMERLQNNIIGVIGRIPYSSYDACGFYDQPDERLSSAKEIVARHDTVLNDLFSHQECLSCESRLDMLEKLSFVRYGRTDGMLSEIPFVEVFSGETVWLPVAFNRFVFGANGMASGNTMKECLVQGLSEIFERYVNLLVLRCEITPPPIPREYLKQWDVSDTIAHIEESGRYRVRVYDCSLGKGYPVAMSLINDCFDGTIGIKFGAHPSLPVAVERTLTEAFQGRNIKQFSHINALAACGDNTILDSENIRSISRDGFGTYPVSLFAGKPDWEFVPWGVEENASNETMLRDMLALLKRDGRRILIRDVSHLGFPSCCIIVSGMSEIDTHVSDKIDERFDWLQRVAPIKRFPHLTPEEEQALLDLEPRMTGTEQRNMTDMLDRPLFGAKMRTPRIFGFLYLSRGEFDEARDYFAQLAKYANEIGAVYWRAMSTYSDWRSKGKGHEEALRIVELLYEPTFARRVEACTRDLEHVMEQQFPQMNCDDCAHCELGEAGFCLGLAHKKAHAKIAQALSRSTVRQGDLVDRIAAIMA